MHLVSGTVIEPPVLPGSAMNAVRLPFLCVSDRLSVTPLFSGLAHYSCLIFHMKLEFSKH